MKLFSQDKNNKNGVRTRSSTPVRTRMGCGLAAAHQSEQEWGADSQQHTRQNKNVVRTYSSTPVRTIMGCGLTTALVRTKIDHTAHWPRSELHYKPTKWMT